ncbi:MAG: alpha/beta hydrolase [Campylobacterota bacterium]|nr:alpha/beta hydrolase [Campylobacterota bacterium]
MRPINLTLYFIFLLFFIFLNGCNAEKSRKTYAIAQEHLHFRDLNQSNYLISAEIFYPCESNNTIVNSKFPLIIFAHGYQQAYGDYRYLWEALVAQGYILAFLTTQGGLSIDIDSYSNDILSLRNELMNTSNTIIAGHITKKSALMGHSTGGGATLSRATSSYTLAR